MKKTLLFLGIGLFFLFPFLVHAKDDVRIVEAGVLEKSEHATEVEEISYQQLTLSFKLYTAKLSLMNLSPVKSKPVLFNSLIHGV